MNFAFRLFFALTWLGATLLLSFETVCAQGCSDAGFCTMGAMKPDQHYNKKLDVKLRSVEINAYLGTTTLTPVVSVLTADMTISIFKNLFMQVKLPYQHVEGTLGSTSGLGDISISATTSVYSSKNGSLSATIGTKIPSNDADLDKKDDEFGAKGADFPMYYQVSLGSYDIVAGASWINRKWLFATGIQIPLTENKNNFDSDQWPDYPSETYVEKYPLANNLKRGTDIMLRVERNFRFTNFNFSAGLLPIYRITKDERYDIDEDRRVKVEGTTGLALSALVSAGYSLDVNNSLKLILGQKITDREENPDGLTRGFVMSLSYVYRF